MIANRYVTQQGKAQSSPIMSRTFGFSFQEVAAFVVPFLIFIQFDAVGRLYVSELLLLAVLPFLVFFSSSLFKVQRIRMILVLGIVWLIGQIATDIYRQTPFDDYSRGWSKIVFTITNFSALCILMLRKGRRPLVLFALGWACGSLIGVVFHTSGLKEDSLWKMVPGPAVSLIVAALLSNKYALKVPFIRPIVMVLLAGVNIFLSARSLGGVCFVTAIYLLAQEIVAGRSIKPRKISLKTKTLIFIVLVGSAILVSNIYSSAASRGYLGTDAQQKYAVESTNRYGILLGGRPEAMVSTQAVLDSPILGHGSWAKDRYYVNLFRKLVQASHTTKVNEDIASVYKLGAIPTHSHLMGAWVDGGILGAVFWVYILVLVWQVLSKLLFYQEPLSALIAFSAIGFAWDILFSPFGADRRLFVAYNLILLIFAWYQMNRAPNAAKAQ